MSEHSQPVLRSAVRRLTGVRIVATGGYVPEQVVRNEDLASLGYDSQWILQRTGIRERRFAPPEMATSDVALAAYSSENEKESPITRSNPSADPMIFTKRKNFLFQELHIFVSVP